MPSLTKFQRLFDLLAYLAGRRTPVPVERLLSELPGYSERWASGSATARATARRTFERDKEELRAAGFAIAAHGFERSADARGDETSAGEGYTLGDGDLYLPYLKLVAGESRSRVAGSPPSLELTEGEARAALEALRHVAHVPDFPFRAEARAVYRKLTFDLDPERFDASPVGFAVGRREDLSPLARALADALGERRRVTFHYRGIARGEPTLRDVAPYGLLFHRGQWYLIGRDAGREAVRTFRLSRIQRLVSRRANPPEYEIPADFDLAAHVGLRPWELGDGEARPVRVRFRFPASLRAERAGLGTLVERRSDGSAIRTFDVVDAAAFGRWVLGLGGDAEVELPAETSRDLNRVAARIAELHGETADG